MNRNVPKAINTQDRGPGASRGRDVRLSLIRIVAISAFVLTLGCSVSKSHTPAHDYQVLFVCEHGNVKSLIAASYFNQLARERRLALLAVARGSGPPSPPVPPAPILGPR